MDEALLASLWPLFADEGLAHLAAIGEGLLGAEAAPPAERRAHLEEVRRAAHSFKGSAASLGLEGYARAAHAVEDVLAAWRDGASPPGDALPSLLGALRGLEDSVRAQRRAPDGLEELLARLAAAGTRPPPAAGGQRPGAPVVPERAAAVLAELEHLVARLSGPGANRPALVAEAVTQARALAEAVAGSPTIGALATDFAARLGPAAQASPEGARALAGAAGVLVDLGVALEALAPTAGALPRTPSPVPQPAPERPRAGRTLRVAEPLVAQLAAGVEALAQGRTRTEAALRDVTERLRGLRGLEKALGEWVQEAGRGGAPEPAEGGQSWARLQAALEEVEGASRRALRDVERQQVPAASSRDALDSLQMDDAGSVLEPLRRTAREVAGRLGKEVEVTITGAQVRVDRQVLDGLRDALVHLVRNALDHGLEPPEARLAQGKGRAGLLRLGAERRGNRAIVTVADDGRGLDVARVRATAVERGLVPEAAARGMSEAEVARLIFAPGFSTAPEVSEFSGRGVGLDAVQEAARRLFGSVEVDWTPGQGTRFTLDVPLHLAAAQVLLVRAGGELAALSSERVEQVLRLRAQDLDSARAFARVGGQAVPFTLLDRLWGGSQGHLPGPGGDTIAGLVVRVQGSLLVLGVDEVLLHQQLVVQPLSRRFFDGLHLAGAGQLDDGRVVGVLDVEEVTRRAALAVGVALEAASPGRPRVLVCDDSLTTRSIMKGLLERGGFEVVTASDGEEAFEVLLRSQPLLVVSDWEMPRLDGRGLVRRMRDDGRTACVPFVLVTSLEAPEERAAGLAAGANAYLVKREVAGGRLVALARELLGLPGVEAAEGR